MTGESTASILLNNAVIRMRARHTQDVLQEISCCTCKLNTLLIKQSMQM
jgi:hypothetical protein